jgi:hypothetical protein
MILDYLWQYPAYVNLLNIVDLVSVSYPPVSLIPRSMVDRTIKYNIGFQRMLPRQFSMWYSTSTFYGHVPWSSLA